jgi:hypothetical protein
MALVTNTITRYDSARAVREQLADVIYNISPVDVPFMSNIGRGNVKNTYFEWQTDALAAASSNNAQLEGDDVSGVADARAPTARVGNYTQISRKIVATTGTVEAVNKAGMRTQQAYQLAKASNELKRDMESTLTAGGVAVVGNDTTARKTAGLGAWIITNYVAGSGTSGAAPAMSSGSDGFPTTAAVAGGTRTCVEATLKSAIQKVWTQGGDIDRLMVMTGPFNKTNVSTFNGIATRFREVRGNSQASIIGAADVYVSDFGTVRVVPNRFQPETNIYLVDKDYAAVQYLRPFRTVELARTGDADKRMILVEYGLQVRAEKAMANIADCSTS